MSGLPSVEVAPREILGLVGEILWKGKDLLEYSVARARQVCGNDIAMIFQELMASLDPKSNRTG